MSQYSSTSAKSINEDIITEEAMARSSAELDFFGIKKESIKPPVYERRRSFRDISKLNPEVLKSVIGNASFGSKEHVVVDPTFRLSCGYENNSETSSPMTIFYNGKVSVFNVSPHKAQEILKQAEESLLPNTGESLELNSNDRKKFLEFPYEDLPITRRKSLQRFLEKRKERLASTSPYKL